MKYPLRGDYETVVKYLDKFVFDSVLKKGKPVTQTHNPSFLRSYNGGKAVVYEIQTNPKKYALKCWVEDLGDLKIRYQAIDHYLKTVKLPYFVDFTYNEQGILVNGQKFPIVRMEWIDGISFKRFLTNNINNLVCIRDFADKFLEMVTILHQNNISHGDLQHGNIMVRKSGDICLIDYDSLYVPKLSNEKDNIKGLPGYQHPKRNKLNKLSPKSDYFSELVIYLSLLVLSEHPQYWQKIEQEERLLFSEKDLCNSRSSKIFGELAQLSDEIRYFTRKLDEFCQETDPEKLQPLENLVSAYKGTNSSNIWDIFEEKFGQIKTQVKDIFEEKFGQIKTPVKDIFEEKFGQIKTPEDPFEKLDQIKTPVKDPSTDKNIWDKFDHIWNKFAKLVSSIWHKIFN